MQPDVERKHSVPAARRVGKQSLPVVLGRQRGAGLVEVMVAVVIVAFALLGMAGLQVSSLRYQKTAHVRMLAAQYTADIGDRMRANMAGAASGNYVTATGDTYAGGAGTDPGNCDGTATLTATQAAACDLYNWRVNLNNSMKGWGEVAGAHPKFTVTVYFREPNKKDYDTALYTGAGQCRAAALAATDTDVRCFQTDVTL